MKKFLSLVLAAAMTTAAMSTTVSADWKQDAAGSWSWSENGMKATGWKSIGGKWYYFDQNGIMKTGWQKIGGAWYFLKSNGEMATGWLQNGGNWYYLESWGGMATGWKQLGGNWYYLMSSGAMATGWQEIGGKWYYMDANGVMTAESSSPNNSSEAKAGDVLTNGSYFYVGGVKFAYIDRDFQITNERSDIVRVTAQIVGVKADGTYEFVQGPAFYGMDQTKYEQDLKENGWAIETSTNMIRPGETLTATMSVMDFSSLGYAKPDIDGDGYYDTVFTVHPQIDETTISVSLNDPKSDVYKINTQDIVMY